MWQKIKTEYPSNKVGASHYFNDFRQFKKLANVILSCKSYVIQSKKEMNELMLYEFENIFKHVIHEDEVKLHQGVTDVIEEFLVANE